MSTLMEDLIILAVGLKPKAGPNTGVLPPQFRFGVRGGELVMLAMAGRVVVANGRIEVRDPAPLADPALNIVLSRLVKSGGAGLKRWIVDPPPEYIISYFDRLRAAGAIREVQVKKLFSARHTGYLIVDQAYFGDVRTRLHEAVTGPVDAAHAALAGVVYAAGLAELAYPGPKNAAARNRLRQLASASPAVGASSAASANLAVGAKPAARGVVPLPDDPNRWAPLNVPPDGAGVSALEDAVRSATQAAVHAVNSSVHDVFHAVSAAGSSVHHASGSGPGNSHHHSSGSGSSDSSPSHHH